MRCNILIWCFWLFSLCFVQKGVANVVLDPQTNRPISADSILNNVMTFAPFYEKLVTDYRADLYIKGTMDIKRKNFILRYVPSMFRLQKGVRQYMVETYSDLHFTAPNIYDQKVKASMGTVHNSREYRGCSSISISIFILQRCFTTDCFRLWPKTGGNIISI